MEIMRQGKYDVAIAGGGPAGCAAGIELARSGRRVLLLEAGTYPRQKVCGEFVSGEALPVLRGLLRDRYTELVRHVPEITRAILYGEREAVNVALPAAARSISRYELDHQLWQAAIEAGAEAHQPMTVLAIHPIAGGHTIRTTHGAFEARRVIDATGRWSRLNAEPKRTSGWIGIKAHMLGSATEGAVSLFFFDGGYCGVEAVGPGLVNVCAMVEARRAKTVEQVLRMHSRLQETSGGWRVIKETLITSPLIPGRRKRLGILRVGDAAGFLHPFLGDGISMALRSGMMAAEDIQSGEGKFAARFDREFGAAFRVAWVGGKALRLPAVLRNAGWALLARSPMVAEWVTRQGR